MAAILKNKKYKITELAVIIDREPNTIRKWEKSGKLPEHLISTRIGNRQWRYWTHEQIYGDDGIIAWMTENDIRPGNLITHPNNTKRHLQNMRKPRFIDGYAMRTTRRMIKEGKSAKQIARKVNTNAIKRKRNKDGGDVSITPLGFPTIDRWYSSLENVEKALRKACEIEGLDFPEPSDK